MEKDAKVVKCQCPPTYLGQICEIPAENSDKVVTQFINELSLIEANKPLSNEMINKIQRIRDIMMSNPNSQFINSELTNMINNLAATQVELIAKKEAPVNPNLLNVLDFAFELSM